MRQNQQVALLAVLSFLIYGACRARFVGDCDSWAYFAQAQLFLGRDPGLHSFASPLRHPALTPLGMDIARGGFVSAFPPGFSLLLALAGTVGGEYWVDPILGALSVVLVYAAVRRDAQHPVALTMAALWALCPLVAVNATDVMSDMAATVTLLGSYFCLRSGRYRLAGALLGLSLMIRPMNLLFLPCAVLLLPRSPRAWSYFFGAFVTLAAVSAGTQMHVWGDFLSPSYRDNAHHFVPKYFPVQFPPYALETALHLGPILALSLVQALRAPKESAPEIAWFGAFLFVYPFAGPVNVDWTRTRFLLPAFPAAFVLAARAWTEVRWLIRRLPHVSPRLGPIFALVPALSWAVVSVVRTVRLGALSIQPERDVDCDALAARLPRNALIGALEFSGSARLYAGLETFVWMHPEALAFAKEEYAKGRPLYLLLEPNELLPRRAHPYASRFTLAFDLEPQFELQTTSYLVNRIAAVRESGQARLSLAHPMAQWALLDGWLSVREHWSTDYRAVACELARLELQLERGVAYDLDLVAGAADGAEPRTVELSIGGRSLGSRMLGAGLDTHTFRIASNVASGRAALELRFPGAPKCDSQTRTAVARVQSVETRALRQ